MEGVKEILDIIPNNDKFFEFIYGPERFPLSYLQLYYLESTESNVF